jgi:arylsulfatase A-like enzyme
LTIFKKEKMSSMKTLIIKLLTFTIAHCSLLIIHCSLTTAQTKPNIVYILADDLGYGDLSCYGQKFFKTPTLDSLAHHGIRFTQHYTGSPVCAPSRASLMTGRDPGHSRVRGNYETGPHGFGAGWPLQPKDYTVAEVLKLGGYSTAIFGKWGLGVQETTGAPWKQGFDYSYGYLNQGHAHNQFPDHLFRNGSKEEIFANRGGQTGAFSGDLLTQDAMRFLDRQKRDKPFFLYLAYVTPHAELLVPDDSLFQACKGIVQERAFMPSKAGGNINIYGGYRSQIHPAAAYAAMVIRLDRDIRKIVDQLKKKGLHDNTIIMFASDNGSHREGGADPAYFDSNGGLRGAKRDVYDGGIRTPFIVYWPGIVSAGSVSDHISGFWDIMATVADIAGVDLKKNHIPTEGISLLPTLKAQNKDQKQHNYLYWEFHEGTTSHQAMRSGEWKVVRLDPDASIELYNLKDDPAEKVNVASVHPQLASRMTAMMDEARTPHELWPLKGSVQK